MKIVGHDPVLGPAWGFDFSKKKERDFVKKLISQVDDMLDECFPGDVEERRKWKKTCNEIAQDIEDHECGKRGS